MNWLRRGGCIAIGALPLLALGSMPASAQTAPALAGATTISVPAGQTDGYAQVTLPAAVSFDTAANGCSATSLVTFAGGADMALLVITSATASAPAVFVVGQLPLSQNGGTFTNLCGQTLDADTYNVDVVTSGEGSQLTLTLPGMDGAAAIDTTGNTLGATVQEGLTALTPSGTPAAREVGQYTATTGSAVLVDALYGNLPANTGSGGDLCMAAKPSNGTPDAAVFGPGCNSAAAPKSVSPASAGAAVSWTATKYEAAGGNFGIGGWWGEVPAGSDVNSLGAWIPVMGQPAVGVPEVPVAWLVPLAGVSLAGAALLLRRRPFALGAR